MAVPPAIRPAPIALPAVDASLPIPPITLPSLDEDFSPDEETSSISFLALSAPSMANLPTISNMSAIHIYTSLSGVKFFNIFLDFLSVAPKSTVFCSLDKSSSSTKSFHDLS